jgi:hypothetical protein
MQGIVMVSVPVMLSVMYKPFMLNVVAPLNEHKWTTLN